MTSNPASSPQEDLGEQERHVCRLELACSLSDLGPSDHSLKRLVVEDQARLDPPEPRRHRGIEDPASSVGRFAGLRKQPRALLDLGLVGFARVGDVDQQRLRRGELVGEDLVEEADLPGLAPRLKRVERFVDRADAGEAVGVDEAMVEVAHRQAGDEGVNPERESREFDGHRVDVEAVDAAASDLPAQQADLVDLALGDVVGAERVLARRRRGAAAPR